MWTEGIRGFAGTGPGGDWRRAGKAGDEILRQTGLFEPFGRIKENKALEFYDSSLPVLIFVSESHVSYDIFLLIFGGESPLMMRKVTDKSKREESTLKKKKLLEENLS